MKITLINTPFIYLDNDDVRHSQCLGPRYICSYLKKHGFKDITFIDGLREGFSTVTPYRAGYARGLTVPELTARVARESELIGISVSFSQLAPLAHDIAESVKATCPGATVVLGGVYPSTSPERALESAADLVVVGEGERAFLQLAQGVPPGDIQGVYGKEHLSAGNKHFPAAAVLADLDAIPFPDYSLPNMDAYFDRGQRAKKTWERTATLVTSRGCPFDCEFCSIHPVYGYRWRGRSAENVPAELEYVYQRFGITRFEIEDDNFTLNKERTVGILEGMIRLRESGFPLEWRVPNGIRMDTVDEKIIGLFKRANCRQVNLALEHGSPEMLEIMNKKLSLDKAYHVISGFAAAGLEAVGLFVLVGYPGESEDYFNASIGYLESLAKLGGNIYAIPCIAQPFPGTRLLKRCLEKGYLSEKGLEDFFACNDIWNSAQKVIIQPPGTSREEVLRREKRIISVFE